MKNKTVSLLILLFLFLSFQSFSQKINHPLTIFQETQPKSLTNDTINILAVMVQFQTDKDTLTTGNGTFDLSNIYKDSVIDAPPHNRDYFTNHLLFLKNYFEKVSDKKVLISFTVPNKIYTLQNNMKYYAPPKDSGYGKLANFVNDSWKLVDSISPEIDFSKYQCFMIFHAGAGRDIDFASVYGYDPTPYDLPSIYFNQKSLQQYLGNSFQGVPVDKGKYFINNTAIIPEMEYRELSSIVGKSLLQLSINGLIASSFGSYLGLPDLFDTKTGSTAIGRFGLMDGQSIFSNNGLFPPEPSAWEKVYLGWVNPTLLTNSTQSIYAHHTDGKDNSNYRIYKVPINSNEYFLVECRFRDPNSDTQKIKVWYDGKYSDIIIGKNEEYFSNSYFKDKLTRGVLVDVEDIDGSLPWGYDYKDNFLNGGILIWHIDENVINSKIATNSINDDPKHRGVDVEEADGSQDIGQNYGMFTSGSGSENGTPLDFWYNDLSYYNPDSLLRPVYKNEFSANSNPSSAAYDRSNSHIIISDFSKLGPVMSFKVKTGDESVSVLDGFPIHIEKVLNADIVYADFIGDGKNEIALLSNNKLYVFDQNGKSVVSDSTGKVLEGVISFTAYDIYKKGKSQIICDKINVISSKPDHMLEVYDYKINNGKGSFELLNTSSELPNLIDSLFISVYEKDNLTHIVAINKAKGVMYDKTFKSDLSTSIETKDVLPNSKLSSFIVNENVSNIFDWISIFDNKYKAAPNSTGTFEGYSNFKNFVGGKFIDSPNFQVATVAYDQTAQQIDMIVFDTKTNTFVLKNKLFSNACYTCWNSLSNISVADMNGDGLQDIIFTSNGDLYVYNSNGTSLNNFPVKLANSISSIPVSIADIDGDKSNDILAATSTGQIYAIDKTGKTIDGFPISIGVKPATIPTIIKVDNQIGLSILGTDGNLYSYKLKGSFDVDHIPWIGNFGNNKRTSFSKESLKTFSISSGELLPKAGVYNYPNPVYGSTTKIRFYLSENSSVNIKIYDITGEKVAELNGNGLAGVDNEIEWNVKNIPTGVYLARVEAKSASKSSVVIIKVAIVK